MNMFERTMDVLRLSYIYRPGMELLAGVAFAATFLVGGYWLTTNTAPGPMTGTLSVGDFVIFLMLTQRIVDPLAEVSNIVDQYENAKASSERIFGLMDIPVHVDDPDEPAALEPVQGQVAYEDVSFSYEDSEVRAGSGDETAFEETVIEDISFDAEPGETVAFVGATGAGKSTVLKLLLRLYDVQDGTIRLDGHDVREIALSDLRSQSATSARIRSSSMAQSRTTSATDTSTPPTRTSKRPQKPPRPTSSSPTSLRATTLESASVGSNSPADSDSESHSHALSSPIRQC